MECRKLEITLVSANDLPDIRRLGLMKVYAKVHLMKGSESKTSKKTPVDREGDINPKWNFPVKYTLRESTVKQPGVYVVVKLYCERTLGDKTIGEAVNIPVKSLFDKGLKAEQIISYVVAGTPNGRLNILYSFANDLPDIRSLSLMKVYVKVSLKGSESKTSQKTPVDKHGDVNPRWNFPIQYTLSESTVQQAGVNVVVKLYCRRTLGDKLIGEVNIPVKSLFDKGLKAEKIMSYGVAGTPNGRLNILYCFGERFWVEKSSGWKKTALGVGFLVLVGGALILLGGEDDESDDVKVNSRDVHHGDEEEDDDDVVFYDAR
ncbi:hypothetical protein BUALT_Bualt08G0124000 [Buddleja alternifolia]|uniref:C2 domain-containing protein n=1 Tax=Buddleja alternifolia TaxID=168488 RepID=A0AAV6X7F9_9LAMI|nr:hypothetical protein BUALT_Bualt08G0124000 [Buddleja alternifolia]